MRSTRGDRDRADRLAGDRDRGERRRRVGDARDRQHGDLRRRRAPPRRARSPVSARSRSVTGPGSVIVGARLRVERDDGDRVRSVAADERDAAVRRDRDVARAGVFVRRVRDGDVLRDVRRGRSRSMIATPSCVTACARGCPAAKPTATGRYPTARIVDVPATRSITVRSWKPCVLRRVRHLARVRPRDREAAVARERQAVRLLRDLERLRA